MKGVRKKSITFPRYVSCKCVFSSLLHAARLHRDTERYFAVRGLDNVIGNMRANIPEGNTRAVVSSTAIQAYVLVYDRAQQADRGIRIGVFKFEVFSNNRNRGRPGIWHKYASASSLILLYYWLKGTEKFTGVCRTRSLSCFLDRVHIDKR